jgi:hypothetical protein
VARERGSSEAELIRETLSRLVADEAAPAPRLPLFRATGPSIAEDVESALEGFGQR